MGRPKLLDLFCCEGGAGTGYHQAGFDVTGVDLLPQPRYPFTFVQADALEYVKAHGHEYDAIHASPPCQAFTTMNNRQRGKGGKADSHPDLLAPTRDALEATGKPFIIENVMGARAHMRGPVRLTGGMFGLQVDRPRLFESNVPLEVSLPNRKHRDVIGVYGERPDGRRLGPLGHRIDGTHQRAANSEQEGQQLMGMPWASWYGCTQAIPPAYTEYLGRQLLEAL